MDRGDAKRLFIGGPLLLLLITGGIVLLSSAESIADAILKLF